MTGSRQRLFLLTVLILATIVPGAAQAQVRSEYRAFWVDTFNTTMRNQAEVQAVVDNAKLANANAIFAQVRRRGDAWYLNSLEPRPDFTPFEPEGFDPLQALITAAHAERIEVHAFVIVGAIWNKNPNFAPSATLGPPANPNHPFNLHSGYDPLTSTIVPGPNNWLTRTLLPDGAAGVAFQGHRFGNDFWIDLGHPDASAYTVDILMHLVRNYGIDGLHLDRIRYPEISVTGQTPSTGTNIGYNAVNVSRFQARHGLPATSMPAPGDPQWMQWRRDQVTNFVRRLYLYAMAERPELRISAALIVFGNAPVSEGQWNTAAEAYWRVYQDWRAWTEEGIIDIAIPMNYKAESVASNVTMFNEWNEWTKNHQYNRAGIIGMAGTAPNNSVEGLLRQTRRALAPSSTGNAGAGVIYFSMANTNAAFSPNPLAFPAPRDTPVRTFAEFASALRTGRSGTTQFEDPAANPVGIFSEPAFIPDFPWKSAPTKGHLKGFARRADGTPLDTAAVMIEHATTGATRATQTDGGGFYGGVDLTPGPYFVKAVLGTSTLYGCVANVVAGSVTTMDLAADTTRPLITGLRTSQNRIWPPDQKMVTVRLSYNTSDNCGTVTTTVGVTSNEPVDGTAWIVVNDHEVELRAERSSGGNGRVYTITVTARDAAGNTTSDSTTVTVPKNNGKRRIARS